MRPETRSLFIAALAGMMAAAYLDSAGRVDFSFGYPEGGLVEGALMALFGAVGGVVMLLIFRVLRKYFEKPQE